VRAPHRVCARRAVPRLSRRPRAPRAAPAPLAPPPRPSRRPASLAPPRGAARRPCPALAGSRWRGRRLHPHRWEESDRVRPSDNRYRAQTITSAVSCITPR